MTLQNYLQTSRSLAKLASLGDIRELNADEHIISKLLDLTSYSSSSADQIYSVASRMFALCIQGGVLPKASNFPGIKVKAFEIGKYAVTKEEWQSVRNWAIENGFDMAEGTSAGMRHPVQHVSWYDCVKWCNARSEMAGLTPVYEANGKIYRSGEYGPSGSSAVTQVAATNGYRLPTESEWEWAARGGCNSQGYTFAGSNDFEVVAFLVVLAEEPA
jgi:hypothetical protein